MDDLISRQAALDMIHSTFSKSLARQRAEECIKKVPSARVERKKGEWIYGKDEYGIDGYHCDKCGFFVPRGLNVHKFINYIEDYNYCPSCGTAMKERQEE